MNQIKSLKLLFTLISLSLVGCMGNDTPILNNPKYPYVVTSIVVFNGGMCRYYSENNGFFTDIGVLGEDRCLIAPTGMYNVGDTILLRNKTSNDANHHKIQN